MFERMASNPGFYPDRWTETKLIGDGRAAALEDRRPKARYEYWVTGRGGFPADMLRHDQCWPASADDAAKLTPLGFGGPGENRSIKMRSYQKPEVGRWTSFGWTVSQDNLNL